MATNLKTFRDLETETKSVPAVGQTQQNESDSSNQQQQQQQQQQKPQSSPQVTLGSTPVMAIIPNATMAATTTTTITTNNNFGQPTNPITTTVTLSSTTATTTPPALIATQPTIVTKAPIISAPQEQQAPLALTTQTPNRPQLQTTPTPITTQQPSSQSVTQTSVQSPINHPVAQLHTKILPAQTITTQSTPITLATAPTTTGPTALVIIPQHSATTSITTGKASTITTKATPTIPTSLTAPAAGAAHVSLNNAPTTIAQPSTTIHMQSPVTTTMVPTLTQVPITAHQQSATLTPTSLVNRPPQTLPVVPITTTTTQSVKQESNSFVCCLLDNGVRCGRIAGNASFSARIQKIVASKKMNYALDPAGKHTYICEHHKAIITVAKKSTTLARETKSNARSYAANNAKALNQLQQQQQHQNSLNEMTMDHSALQHPINYELLANQNRLANNHAGVMNSGPLRAGVQLTYGHYPASHQDHQLGAMNSMPSNFDNTGGGDSIPSSSGGVDVDLQQLQVNTLRRYKRHFRVQTRPGLNKMQLAESLKNHFRTLPIIEKEAITYFVYIVKCYRNKLDLNSKAD